MTIPNRALADEIRDAYHPRLNDFLRKLQEWTAAGSPETQAQADALNDFVAGAKALEREIDADRKVRKAVHDAAAKGVQDAFKLPLDAIGRVSTAAKALLAPFFEAEERRRAQEAQELAAEAALEAERAAAARRRAQAEGDVMAVIEAEEAQVLAEERAVSVSRVRPVRVGSASGGARAISVRRIRDVEITDLTKAFLATRDDAGVRDAILAAGRARVRAASFDGEPIAGFAITERKAL